MSVATLGIDRIVSARLRGFRPAGVVFVDVSLSLKNQWAGRYVLNGPVGERICTFDVPESSPQSNMRVFVSPTESTRLMDWSWAVGLDLTIEGDDEARIMSAYEKAVAAGAAHVIAACPFGPVVSSIWGTA